MTRRHVLGELYQRCDQIEGQVPVFIVGSDEPSIGHVDQCLGHYADAFTFHVPDDICKQLSAGYFTFSFEYELIGAIAPSVSRRIRINSISLTARKNYTKPEPRHTLANA